MGDYAEKLAKALEKDETIVIGADCSIDYSGRAESFLPFGERIIIIKSDKNLIVHQPKGTAPVNYMKAGSVHNLEKVPEGVVLSSKNSKEFMRTVLRKIHFIQTKKLDDNAEIMLNGSEKQMSDMIVRNPELISRDFRPLSREEHTKYGFIDVFGHDKEGNLVVVECKRYSADLGAVTQLRRYVEKIKQLKGIENVNGILASPKISANALKMLEDWGFEHRKIDPPKYLEKHRKSQKALNEF
ncbi:MAG TPA: DUF91 domain-containing protein [Candidatus Woesearchaeota archaeon]|nr:DUF91 domain-containing protein [Candidatus Woesearchaeota archaeon]